MKKSILMTAAVVVLIGGGLLESTVASADPTSLKKETKGKVGFEIDTALPNHVKPDEGKNEPEVITPEDSDDPTNNKGVWLNYAPNFNFGNVKISTSEDKEYNAKNILYSKNSEPVKEGETAKQYELPQYLQVADQSGVKGTAWEVSAYQVAAFSNTTTSAELTNARIRFYGTTLTNSIRKDNLSKAITGLQIPDAAMSELGVGSGEAVSMLKTLASKEDESTTNGTVSSLVFKKGYQASNYGNTEITDKVKESVNNRGDNSDVRLFVPYKDTPQAVGYEAAIVWTLTVGA